MQLLLVTDCLQDAGQQESDYESQGSESDRSEQDPENQVILFVYLHLLSQFPFTELSLLRYIFTGVARFLNRGVMKIK